MEHRNDLQDILLGGLEDAERREVEQTIRRAHREKLEHLRSRDDDEPISQERRF